MYSYFKSYIYLAVDLQHNTTKFANISLVHTIRKNGNRKNILIILLLSMNNGIKPLSSIKLKLLQIWPIVQYIASKERSKEKWNR